MLKNSIKVGEYLRLDNGYIYKWESNDYEWIYEEEGKFVYGNGANEYEWESDIVNHSFNIIDLIEVGDYVNGIQINERIGDSVWHFSAYGDEDECLKSKDIKTIVTHEQMKAMEYKIER